MTTSVIGMVLLACIAIGSVVGVVLLISMPQPESLRPAEGNWNFSVSGCWAFCSQYKVGYIFPPAVNTSTINVYHLNFTVINLQGTTGSVQLHRLNVTIRDDGGRILHFKAYNSNVGLGTGETWRSPNSSFTITDEMIGLKPGMTTTVRAEITAEFDEILGVFGSHYGKTEKSPTISIEVRSPSQGTPRSAPFSLNLSLTSIMPFFLIGSIILAATGVLRTVRSVPRHGSFGWRDPSTGRFVSSKAAFIAILSLVGGAFLWFLSVLGTPNQALSYGDLILGAITNNLGISAPLSILLFVIGILFNVKQGGS